LALAAAAFAAAFAAAAASMSSSYERKKLPRVNSSPLLLQAS
jgi:hypothetical protein